MAAIENAKPLKAKPDKNFNYQTSDMRNATIFASVSYIVL